MATKTKMNPKTLPVVREFGRKNYGTTVGQQVVGVSDLEEHDHELGARPSPRMGRKKKKRRA